MCACFPYYYVVMVATTFRYDEELNSHSQPSESNDTGNKIASKGGRGGSRI